MKLQSNDIYIMTDDREKKLWADCIFVFDTSALLDFYLFPDAARAKIYSEIFNKLNNRLWMPNHVQFEYLRKRESVIESPITDCYDPLKVKLQNIIGVFKKSLNDIEDIKNRTKKEDHHPHIDHTEIIAFEQQLTAFIKQAEDFDKRYRDQIEKKENEISGLKNKDTILAHFNRYFKVGREYSFKEIMDITLEGKHRYEYQIPPGYKDAKEKEGTQIFGDLIIWKQILEHAKKTKKNIVLVCNDVKTDWCYIDKDKRIKSPRAELIKEMKDHSSVQFWMYNQEQFMYLAKKLLKSSITNTQIQSVSRVITEKNRNQLRFKCKNCGALNKIDVHDLNLVFDYSEAVEERPMGPEIQHTTAKLIACTWCGDEIEAQFDIWEYPIGVKNDQAITLEGAILVNECDLELDLLHKRHSEGYNESEGYNTQEGFNTEFNTE